MTQYSSHLPPPTVALASYTSPGTFPDPDSCWQAVQRRDRSYNGRFWFSVKTTGVYCLPSCAARPALRKNVDFHASPDAAEAAGFRACKRCKPRDWQVDKGLSTPVARACALFERADLEQAPSLVQVARKVGLSPSALSKRFLAELGFAVAFGVLLDTIIVRSILVTALNLDLGRHMWWPSRISRDNPPAPGGAGHEVTAGEPAPVG